MPKCLALKHALTIGPTGAVRPCCAWIPRVTEYTIDDDWETAHNKYYEEMLDEWLPACLECKQDEELNGKSQRLFMNTVLQDSVGIEYFDFKINNTCNLACIMCDGVSSSTWTAIVKQNSDKNWTQQKIDAANAKTGWHGDISNFYHQLFTAKYVKFTGGEPFLIPQVKQMIEFMVNEEIAPTVELQLVTNGTQDVSKYYDLLKNFKSVILLISVDAIGERYEFIRQGANWNQASDNILSIKSNAPSNTSVVITCLPNLFNKHHIHEVEDWCNENNLVFNKASDLIFPEYLRQDATDYTEQMTILDEIHGTDHKKFL